MALKLLKFALVAVAVLSLFDGTEQTCRPVPYAYREQEGCTGPRDTSVQLQVPEGFAFVEPSFVRVRQCTGQSCQHSRKHCVPQEDNITLRKFNVKAYKENKRVCMKIEVEEHGACHCQCQDPRCRKNMIMEENTCECVCDPEEEENCAERLRLNKNVMWSSKTCSCQCNKNHSSDCGYGEVFDEENCKCVEDKTLAEDFSYNDVV